MRRHSKKLYAAPKNRFAQIISSFIKIKTAFASAQ